jgi:hypothetical protein
MKKLLLISALAAVASLSAYGQGSVNFANNSATRVILRDSTGATTFVPVGTRFSAELVFAPDGTATDVFQTAATRVGATASFSPVAGQFSAGGRTAAGVVPPGGFGLFQIRVWETGTGNAVDYNSAVLSGVGFAGQSGILRVDTGDPTTTPPGTAASLITAGLASFTVSPVPEPSTIALGLLGVGTLLMLRRRK